MTTAPTTTHGPYYDFRAEVERLSAEGKTAVWHPIIITGEEHDYRANENERADAVEVPDVP